MLIYNDNDNALLIGPWGNGMREAFWIRKSNTGTHSTEVHIATSQSNYQHFAMHTGTTLQETDRTFTFLVGDWDGDGIADLWAIRKSGTPGGKTEVHIWSGASSFQTKILAVETALEATDDSFAFCLMPATSGRPNLGVVKRAGTGSGMTEVHVLSAASAFSSFSAHTVTALHETGTGADWIFAFADANRDGTQDLVIVSPANGGELHCLRGPQYTTFSTHQPLNTPEQVKVFFGLTDAQNETLLALVGFGIAAATPFVGAIGGAVIASIAFGLAWYEVRRQYQKIYSLETNPPGSANVRHSQVDHGADGDHAGDGADGGNDDGGNDDGGPDYNFEMILRQ